MDSRIQLYGQIQKVEDQDDGTIMVHGFCSSESANSLGEITRADAIRAALDGYRQFPALREMYGLSAAGTTLEIEVGDDNITRIVGHVVDESAIKKVRSNTYRGFALGGKVTKRNASNRKIVEGLTISDISLVDRPQPDAILEMWKADPATPLGQQSVTGDQMRPVQPLGSLSQADVEAYLGRLSNEDRATLLISVIMREKIGRRM